MAVIQVAERFNGPPASAHGGYTCGRLASSLAPHSDAAVTLFVPPPLGTELQLRRAGQRLQLWQADTPVASAVPLTSPGEVEPPEWAAADQPAELFAGWRWHPFASCFVCGPDRTDGLRLLPVAVPGRPGSVAAGWTPAAELADADGLVLTEFVWAALDCPGGWSAMGGEQPEALVLSRLAVRLASRPRCGERHVVVGRLDRRAGRTAWVSTALYDADRRLLASAEAQWLSVDPAAFGAAG